MKKNPNFMIFASCVTNYFDLQHLDVSVQFNQSSHELKAKTRKILDPRDFQATIFNA